MQIVNKMKLHAVKKHNPKYKHSHTKHWMYFNFIIFRGTRPITRYKINSN